MKKLILIVFSFLPMVIFSQKKYYQFKKGNPIPEEKYQKVKSNPPKFQSIQETILKVENRQDSIIYHTRWEYFPLDKNGKIFNPYGASRKIVMDKKFPIAKFKNKKDKNYTNEALVGKPTFINFWFTHCPPCIKEIPILNELKKKYGNQVRFISITFDSQKAVNKFIKKTPFLFEHITNASEEINQLKISAFPTNLVLNKNGIVKFLKGDILNDKEDIEIILDELLRQ